MRREDIILKTSLKGLLETYENHCSRNGLQESRVQLYRKLSLRFLKGLEEPDGIMTIVLPHGWKRISAQFNPWGYSLNGWTRTSKA